MQVFVLGAGVASTYGCPLTKDLFGKAIKCSSETEMVSRINEMLKYLYPVFVEEDKNYPNIEEFLSLLDVWREFNSKIQRKPAYSDYDIEQVKNYVIRLLAELLDAQTRDVGTDAPIVKFARCLSPNDVIITFNWDIGIERALDLAIDDSNNISDWRYRIPRRPTKKQVVLLKAHGSIDWFRTKDISFMSHKRRFFLDDALGQISVINSWDYPRYKTRKELIPFIIPPTFEKHFSEGEVMGIWVDIYRALQQAEKIHIFGYSVPQADLHASFTLRAAIQNNLHQSKAEYDGIVKVYNPDSEIRQRFTELIGAKFIFRNVAFGLVDFEREITH